MTLAELRKSGWTWRVIGRVISQIGNDVSRANRSPWDDSVLSIYRILRLLKERPKKQPKTIVAKELSWHEAAKKANQQLGGDRKRFSLEGTWRARCERIASATKLRKGFSMTERVTAKDVLKLLEKQNYTCAYTGERLTPETISADHLISLFSGGDHNVKNLRLVTRTVNQAKGTMSYNEFVEMCRKVVDHAAARESDVFQEYQPDPAEEQAWKVSQETGYVFCEFGPVTCEL